MGKEFGSLAQMYYEVYSPYDPAMKSRSRGQQEIIETNSDRIIESLYKNNTLGWSVFSGLHEQTKKILDLIWNHGEDTAKRIFNENREEERSPKSRISSKLSKGGVGVSKTQGKVSKYPN